MLYDPKWKAKTEDIYSLTSFIAWLEQQDPVIEYEWSCAATCVYGQYLNSKLGRYSTIEEWQLLIEGKGAIAVLRPHTFGGALKRARSLANANQQ